MRQQTPPDQSTSGTWRKAIALVAGMVICILVITPFVLAINRFDWGVGLLLVAPLLIWLLLRLGRVMESWARNEVGQRPPDPDFPDDISGDQ
jgi:cytosine/uracil/thiamine/allantoin permease